MSELVNLGVKRISQGDERIIRINVTPALAEGELLVDPPVVTDINGTGDLALENEQVNSGPVTIDNVVVDAGKAILFTVSGQLASGSPYELKVTVDSDAPETLNGRLIIEVGED